MASARSTRQLLGELDALMDQMLSLPVEEGARNVTAPPPPTTRSDPPRPIPPPHQPPMHPLAVTMTLLDEAPAAEAAPSNSSIVVEPNIDEPIATPTVELPPRHEPPVVAESFWVQEADLVPDPPKGPLAVRGRNALVPIPKRRAEIEVGPIAPLPTRTIHRSYAWALRLNRMLARRTYGLGFVGRFVRSDVGRTILGVVGILMVLIAAGWLAKDLLRWT
jgi:hypothetical protein